MSIAIEFIDRQRPNVVQIDTFVPITDRNQIKIGDRFVCPPSEEYKSGIVDVRTMKPILCTVKFIHDWHIGFSYYPNGKRCASIAWDLCYTPIE